MIFLFKFEVGMCEIKVVLFREGFMRNGSYGRNVLKWDWEFNNGFVDYGKRILKVEWINF